jgi:predicted nucleic-acid-binding protein
MTRQALRGQGDWTAPIPTKQVRVADDFVAAGAWVSLLALAETIWVLTTVYERDAAEIGASVEQLLNHKDLILQDREVVAAALEIFRSRPAPGFTDCVLLESPERPVTCRSAHSTAISARSMAQKDCRRSSTRGWLARSGSGWLASNGRNHVLPDRWVA